MIRHIARLAVLGSLIVMMTAGSHAATVITLWDFQDYYQDPVFLNWVVTPRYHPSIGSGNWSVQGTAVVDPALRTTATRTTRWKRLPAAIPST